MVGETSRCLVRRLGTACLSFYGLPRCPRTHLRKKLNKTHLFGCQRLWGLLSTRRYINLHIHIFIQCWMLKSLEICTESNNATTLSWQKLRFRSDLMIVALTVGGFMWTLSLPPTSRRTVAVKRESFFSTCGGCFSMINVLRCHIHRTSSSRRQSQNLRHPTDYQLTDTPNIYRANSFFNQ